MNDFINDFLISSNQIASFVLAISSIIALMIKIWSYICGRRSKDLLYNALCNGRAVTTDLELKFLLKHYVPQRFSPRNQLNSPITTKKLISIISKSVDGKFAVVGKSALGKTSTMRFMFYKLAKHKKCVYFQMKTIADIADFKSYLVKQQKYNNIGDGDVTAFFDGADEADSLFQLISFQALFLKGAQSKVYKLFEELGLSLKTFVVSIRPEFLEKSVNTLDYRQENICINTYTILEMEDKDILRVFQSFKILKKKDAASRDNIHRHQARYPEPSEEKKYKDQLKVFLQNNPNCIFHYPMFIRYAYVFLKELNEQEQGTTIPCIKDKVSAFELLVNAIIKWEFHIYGEASASGNEDWSKFKASMYEFINSAIEHMLNTNETRIEREALEKILETISFAQGKKIALAHCLMASDETASVFEFAHPSFYEFFAAEYLYKNGDYRFRRSKLTTDGICDFYYAVLYREGAGEEIRDSVVGLSFNPLYSIECRRMVKRDAVELSKCPRISMLEIFKLLPHIKAFQYHSARFDAKQMIQIIEERRLDLEKTGWNTLEYAKDVADPETIVQLKLCKLRLENYEPLCAYSNLKVLDIRGTKPFLEEHLEELRPLKLNTLLLFTQSPTLCDKLCRDIQSGALSIEKVLIETSPYHRVYEKVYELRETHRLAISKRTELAEAKARYEAGGKAADIPRLKAVFELEADCGGLMRLDGDAPEATYWNGMTLAACYQDRDSIDEAKEAYGVYDLIRPYIINRNSVLGVKFSYYFGRNLIDHSICSSAKLWFLEAYRYAKANCGESFFISCAVGLLRAYIKCREYASASELMPELECAFEGLPDKKTDTDYMEFVKYKAANLLRGWVPQEDVIPEQLVTATKAYIETANQCVEGSGGYSRKLDAQYFSAVMYNKVGRFTEALDALKRMEEHLADFECAAGDRSTQGNWIEYYEQKMIALFLSGALEEAAKTAAALIDYPYRDEDKPLNACRYVIEKEREKTEGCTACADLPRYEKAFDNLRNGGLWL